MSKNIKISSRAWQMLRRAKFELQTKNYSQTIIVMDRNIRNNYHKRLKKALNDFEVNRHRIRVKAPSDGIKVKGAKLIIKSAERDKEVFVVTEKTIQLDDEARRILERIKIDTEQSAYTLSDAIEFLIRENNLA